MVTTNALAEIASLIGEPARAAMLQALMDGRALTAGELSRVAAITPQTASGHLAQLAASGPIAVTAQGRHRYHRLAGPQVARLLESMMLVAVGRQIKPPRTGPRDEAMRRARTCYDHFAGRLGVGLAEAMMTQGWIEIGEEAAMLTSAGSARLKHAGIPLPDIIRTPRRLTPLCSLCLDWSERRPHIAGVLGAALCTHALAENWVRRQPGSRALEITPKGSRSFRDIFCIEA